ncbi:unnamed protein product [Ranitomeya imitator]|uniref:Thyroglobulin type-1 domain-containing protein n=1 Tax=Ranitomeya imitator TaxID=111125 RepID=A0ABN9M2R4_9NEOB|nr:unnamed protein product [Ranitomeya imitator]
MKVGANLTHDAYVASWKDRVPADRLAILVFSCLLEALRRRGSTSVPLVVLSCAALSARNVRWCVTSDTEEQKCHDLETSCHVDEILLKCVKKSSTEDCVRAISNGEADAISLDSKDVYKASLHPFNLKPIMTEAYSEREHTPCMRHRQNVLGGKKIRIGAFVPKCDEKGNYVPKQCHGSTGYCWCLNENGEEIEGTRTPPGTKHLTCEDTEYECNVSGWMKDANVTAHTHAVVTDTQIVPREWTLMEMSGETAVTNRSVQQLLRIRCTERT